MEAPSLSQKNKDRPASRRQQFLIDFIVHSRGESCQQVGDSFNLLLAADLAVTQT